MAKGKRLKLGVLLSGGGTTLQNLIDRIAAGGIEAEIAVVISSLSKVFGCERARQAGLPLRVIRKKDLPDVETFSEEIARTLDEFGVDLAVQAGFMCYWKLPSRWMGRVMNIHPALIPAFCGKGMYGHFVHEAAVARGVKLSGCSVHFVDNEYDAGPIILQRAVEVRDDDTPDTLAERVLSAEREIYPEAVRLYASGHLRIEGRRVCVLTETDLN